jgi:hypothetical protein
LKSYKPGFVPTDPAQLPGFLRQVEQKIQQAANAAEQFVLLQVLHAEPARMLPGMVVNASGTTWDPGAGPGLYVRNEDNDDWIHVPDPFASHNHTTADTTGPLTNDEHDGFISIDTSATPSTPAAGKVRLYVQDAAGVGRLRALHSTGSNLAFFRDQVTRVKNTSGGALAVGDIVYVTGATGNFPTVAKAKADAAATMPAFGMVIAAAANNAFTTVQFDGVVTGLDTSAFTEGDVVFTSAATAGAWTATEPLHPYLSQAVGVVTKVNAGAGEVQVFVSQYHEGDDSGTNRDTYKIGAGSGTTPASVKFVNATTVTHTGHPVTVVNLPGSPVAGDRAFVTDATATTFASVVAGGGANKVPTYYDGTNWRIG